MKYGRILSDSWKVLWRSWALWGFVGTWVGITALLVVGVVLGVGGLLVSLVTTLESGAPDLTSVLGITGIVFVASLAMIPLFWVFHAGAIHLSNEALEGRPVRYADGWSAGRRRFGALAGFELLSYLVLAAAGTVVAVLFGVVFAFIFSSGDSSAAAGAAVAGVCFLYIVMFVLYVAAALFVQSFEAVGSRAAVLSGRTGTAAFKDSWSALKHSFKDMLVMGLIVLGVTMAYSTAMSVVTSIVATPLQFAFMPTMLADPTALDTDPAAFVGAFTTLYVIVGGLSFLLTFPLTIYVYLMWTGFYRQLVGLVPAEELAPAPVYPGFVPAPPASEGYAAPSAIPEPPTALTGLPGPPAPPAPAATPAPAEPPVPPAPPEPGQDT